MEREIKLAVKNATTARRLLRSGGFSVHVARIFERNLVLDDEQESLRTSGRLLRVREAGGKVTCTFKGKTIAGRHKQREEREFQASDVGEALALFQGLGFSERFRYEKYRTEFTRKGEGGVVTVDETPIGCFLELEGGARWIDKTAGELGFGATDYITDSYGKLYTDWCAVKGRRPTNFVFAARKR